MADFIVLNAVVQSGRALWELVMTNKQLAENRELVSAVSEVNGKLMSAQSVALEAQQEQAALTQRVRELEQKIMTLESWDREAERYELYMVAPSVPAYRLKSGMENSEPPHNLCANCFARKEKSFLQYGMPGIHLIVYRCTRCNSTFTPSQR